MGKVKKALALLTMTGTLIGSLPGCTKEQTDFLAKLEKVNSWNAYGVELKGTLELTETDSYFFSYYYDEEEEEVAKINFDIKAYINKSKKEAQFQVDVEPDERYGESEHYQYFIKDDIVYIDKDYLQEHSVSGNRFDEITTDYIGIPTVCDYYTLFSDVFYFEEMPDDTVVSELLAKIADMNVDIPLESTNGTYTLHLNQDDIGNIYYDTATELYNNRNEWLEFIAKIEGESVEEYQDELKYLEHRFNDGECFQMYRHFIQGGIYGTDLDLSAIFKEGEMDAQVTGKVQFLKTMTSNCDINLSVKEVKEKTLELPTSTVLTKSEFEQYAYADYYGDEYYDEMEVSSHYEIFLNDVNDIEDIESVSEYAIEGIKENENYYISKAAFDAYLTSQVHPYQLGYDKEKAQYYLVRTEDVDWDAYDDSRYALYDAWGNDEISEEEYGEKVADLYVGNYIVPDAQITYIEVEEKFGKEWINVEEFKKLGANIEITELVDDDKDKIYIVEIMVD